MITVQFMYITGIKRSLFSNGSMSLPAPRLGTVVPLRLGKKGACKHSTGFASFKGILEDAVARLA